MASTGALPRTETSPRLVLWLLLIVYIFNFIDRQIVNILAEPIRRDLGLSDTQIGLMMGSPSRFFTRFSDCRSRDMRIGSPPIADA